jgi:predicted phosphodiesterase
MIRDMKIDFVSDIHLDFWIKTKDTSTLKFKVQLDNFLKEVLFPVPDDFKPGNVLIIAGDTSHYNSQTKALLKELKNVYDEIILVFGNHDMYLVSNSQISKYNSKSENRLIELKEICEELRVHYLDGNVINIDGIKFGGTGSWYNLPTSQDLETWKKAMNDSQKIYSGYAPKAYGSYYNSPVHEQQSINWKTQEFWLKEKSKLVDIAKQGCDVFITHVALNEPTKDEGMHDEYLNSPDNIFYYTDNIELLKQSSCGVHIHGHIHQGLDYIKEGIRILCNPLGYPSNGTYTIIKQIEL